MAGRPTEYKPEYCEIVKTFLYEGYAILEICRELKKSRQCINEWREKHKEFGDTFNEYLQYAEGWWLGEGRKNIGNKNFNSRLYELQMQNRYGWNKKSEQKVEHSGEVKIEHSTQNLSDLKEKYGRDY